MNTPSVFRFRSLGHLDACVLMIQGLKWSFQIFQQEEYENNRP